MHQTTILNQQHINYQWNFITGSVVIFVAVIYVLLIVLNVLNMRNVLNVRNVLNH